MHHIFCIHSSAEGHLGSFQLLAIISRASMNIVEHVSLLPVEHLLSICPGEVLLDLPVVLCTVFWGTARFISKVVVPAFNPTSNGGVFLFLHILSSICSHVNFWYWPFWLVWGRISGMFWFAFLWRLRVLNILFPPLTRTEISTLWSSFLNFMWSVNCILGILSFWLISTYQLVHTMCVLLWLGYLTQDIF